MLNAVAEYVERDYHLQWHKRLMVVEMVQNGKSNRAVVITSTVVATIVSILWLLVHPKILDEQESSEGGDQVAYTSTLDRAKDTGQLRVAYAVGAPLFMIDPNSSEKSGIFYEIVELLGDRLELKVEWVEEVGYGEMPEGLRFDRYDLVGSGVWINSDRAGVADFTNPIYYDSIFAFVRADDDRFSSGLELLNSDEFVISTQDGELGSVIAKQDFPNAKTLELPQNASFSQLIENVIQGKADIVFLALGSALAFQASRPNAIKVTDISAPLRIFQNSLMIPQGQHDFRRALNATIDEIRFSGEIEAILSKYEEHPGTYLRVSNPYRLP